MSYQHQGNAHQQAQNFSQGYAMQQQPWHNSQQHVPGSYNQQYVPAPQYGGWSQQTTQQPAWYGVTEQPAWYGQSMYQGQAAGYTGAHTAQQPASYGYDPNQAAQNAPAQQQVQQGYPYDPAQATQQHAWHAHHAQQASWPAEHVQQHQQVHQPQQSNQQQYQYQDYAAAQLYHPYGNSVQYQQYQPQYQEHVSDGSQQAAQMACQPYNPDRSQPATSAVPSFSEAVFQDSMPPVPHEVAPKPPAVDVASLLFHPQRASRPHSIVVVVRGIPGSGKSWLAQRLRALEIENGGKAPRILSIDPYFIVDDENADARSPGKARETYVYDASKEASYEHALVNKLAQALRDAQHRFVIVDAPLLYAAGVQSFCAVSKAAKYEVFVTQPPDQDPQACYERNVHGRTAQEVLDAARSLESSPSAITQLDCSSIMANSVHMTESTNPHSASMHIDYSPRTADAKRKSADVHNAVETEGKRFRVDHTSRTIDDSAVLAMVDAGLSGSRAGSGQRSSGVTKQPLKRENRSRWSDDDDSEDEGASQSQVRSAQNSQRQLRGAAGTPSSVDSRIQQLLGSKRDRVKKSVRWPDQLGDEEDGAFRIGKPQQLETVHIIPGLGPAEAQPMDTGGGYVSFADAVRAEHQYEKQKLLSRSKG